VERRLTAILAADVVGYSKLMGEDEAKTLEALAELRNALFEPVVAERGGTVIKRMGDGWIVEYPNISDAVASAIEVQEGLLDHEIIRLRIGVHIGDVTFQDEDVYGDGINVAARLEAIAEPGQVLISDTAQQSLDSISTAKFAGGEQHELKNIARSVAVWHWPAGSAEIAAADLSLPDKPSIAVLPFDNMSGDPEQEYFSDGITEDIITALSKFRWFFVISRNSSFTYKGRAVDVTQVGRELGVRYLLEGSVRRAGSRVRITAQLIDASNGNHIWADRYDRELKNVFALQDEIASAITAAAGVELAGAEQERATRSGPENLGAWDLYQQGMWQLWRMGEAPLIRANDILRQAIKADPDLAPAHAGLSYLCYLFVEFGISESPSDTLAEGLGFAETAVQLDEKDAFAHFALGRIHMMRGDANAAMGELDRALELNQNFAPTSYAMGYLMLLLDRAADAIPHFDHALRLSPGDPIGWGNELIKGAALQTMGCLDEAEVSIERSCRYPTNQYWPHTLMAALLASRDRVEEAQTALAIALERKPGLTVTSAYDALPPFDCGFKRALRENLRKAGLPE
jgi:adenylate cyclase